MNGNCLLSACSGDGDGDGARGGIDGTYQATYPALLPVFAVALVLCFHVGTAHRNYANSDKRFSVARWLPTYEDSIAGMDVRELDWGGALQICLPWRYANHFRVAYDLNGNVCAGIRGERERVSVNAFDYAYLFCHGGLRLPPAQFRAKLRVLQEAQPGTQFR